MLEHSTYTVFFENGQFSLLGKFADSLSHWFTEPEAQWNERRRKRLGDWGQSLSPLLFVSSFKSC
jgi:hypothetical protein